MAGEEGGLNALFTGVLDDVTLVRLHLYDVSVRFEIAPGVM